MADSDIQYMQRCLALAQKGRYTARPNPVVGALLVKEGQVLAEGWHEKAGEDHAEIMTLRSAGAEAKGATLYVSLEPCSFTGRTGPCADAVIEAGIVRLVFGMTDPNPAVNGKGLEKIKAAGIEVEGPVLEEQALALNAGFVKSMHSGLPYVRCKLGMSLDGRTAMASGESKWITGPEAREEVQQLRARSGAIVTGIETVLQDDPSLDVRVDFSIAQPLRVIVDSRLRVHSSLKMLSLPGEVIVATAVTSAELLENKRKEIDSDNVTLLSMPNEEGKVDLRALLQFLADERECRDVLLESGAELAGAMLSGRLVDEVITYIAPKFMGTDARPLLNLQGLERLEDALQLEILDVAMVGKDCRMRSRPVY
jgi:diaminohydroxyphosphoribosylaminopyrimidine deaminase/5-amino-6-(5-phosphoribosylamino)uracil reductase